MKKMNDTSSKIMINKGGSRERIGGGHNQSFTSKSNTRPLNYQSTTARGPNPCSFVAGNGRQNHSNLSFEKGMVAGLNCTDTSLIIDSS